MRKHSIDFCNKRQPRRARSGAVALGIALAGLHGTVGAASYDAGVVYTGDLLANVSGGLNSGVDYLDKLDVELAVDFGAVGDGPGGVVFLRGLYTNGTQFSGDHVGDLQVVSNIDASEAWRVFEAWYETGYGRWSLRAGLYDLNSEFDAHETGALFLNSSHGIGVDIAQTGQNGPSIFPVSSLALRGAVTAGPGTLRVVVMDAVPGDPEDASSNAIDLGGGEGILSVAEYDLPLSTATRLWTGYWTYSEAFERTSGEGASAGMSTGMSKGNDGWYGGIESKVELGARTASWFLRFGQANPEFNAIADYTGAGLVIDAPLPGREQDQFGVAVASARVGAPYRESLRLAGVETQRRETTWELTYRAVLGEHLVLQPDIQYVHDPSALSALGNALVLGLRFEVAY